MTDLWTRIPPQHPLPLNYAQGQKFGIAVAADELFYRTDTPLENVLEASVACRQRNLTTTWINFSSTAPESPGRLPRISIRRST